MSKEADCFQAIGDFASEDRGKEVKEESKNALHTPYSSNADLSVSESAQNVPSSALEDHNTIPPVFNSFRGGNDSSLMFNRLASDSSDAQQSFNVEEEDVFVSYKALDSLHEKKSIVFVKNARYTRPPEAYRAFIHYLKPFYIVMPELGATTIDEACGASVVGFKSLMCAEHSTEVITPEYGCVGRYNPVKGDNTVKAVCSRLVGMIEHLHVENKRKGVYLIGIDLTYPDEISRLLLVNSQADVVLEKAKRCEKAFIRWLKRFWRVEADEDIGGWGNTHIWSSKCPLKPHLHHHLNVLNVIAKKDAVKSVKGLDVDKVEPEDERFVVNYTLNEDGGRERVYSLDKALRRISPRLPEKDVKEAWAYIVCREFGDLLSLRYESLDCYLHYTPTKNKPGVLHRFKYCSRKPLMDLFDYYTEHEFDEGFARREYCLRLLGYTNRRDTFGFARYLKRLVLMKEPKHTCAVCGSAGRVVDRMTVKEVYELCYNRKAVFVEWNNNQKEYVLVRRRDRLKECFDFLGNPG